MSLIGDDCFFYYNAGCHKGAICVYRHQPAAKGVLETCPSWLKGSCMNKECTLRHAVIDSRILSRPTNHNMICKFEASTGCLDDQCPYLHVNKVQKLPIASTGLITQASHPLVLPTSVVLTKVATPDTLINTSNPVVINGFLASSRPPTIVGLAPKPMIRMTTQLVPAGVSLQVPTMLQPTRTIIPPGAILRMSAPPAQPSVEILPEPSQNVSILGAPPAINATTFPKNEHFTEQVRLFKEILARKHQAAAAAASQQDNLSDEEELYGGGKYKHKERQKSKRNKKHKESYQKFKKIPNRRDLLNRGDEEMLYGDYKDIKVKKKREHKKRLDKHIDSENNIEGERKREYKKKLDKSEDSEDETKVKSYEEILREKALQDMYRRRKADKFNAVFENLLNEKDNDNKSENGKKRSRSKSDNETNESLPPVKASKKKRQMKSVSPEPKDEIFSKEDAVELGLDASPIRDDFEEPDASETGDSTSIKKISENDKAQKTSKKTSPKRIKIDMQDKPIDPKNISSPTSELDVSAVQIIPDETTDINFSVQDEDDELLQELNQTEEIKPHKTDKKSNSRRHRSHYDKLKSERPGRVLVSKSITSISKEIANKDRSRSSSRNAPKSTNEPQKTVVKAKKFSSVVSVVSKPSPQKERPSSPKKDIDEISSTAKRKVMKLEKEKLNVASKSIVHSPVILSNTDEKVENNNKENTTVKLITDKEVKDDNIKPEVAIQVKVKTFEEIMAEKRKRKKLHHHRLPKEVLVISDDNDPSPIKEAVNLILSHPKLKRENSTEEKAKRKSIKLYKPPAQSIPNAVSESAIVTESKTVLATVGPRKVISLRKPSLSTDIVDTVVTPVVITPVVRTNPVAAIKSTLLTNKKLGGVMSFEEIMKAKRIRKQQLNEERLQKAAKVEADKKNAATTNQQVTQKGFVKRKPVLKRPPLTLVTTAPSLTTAVTVRPSTPTTTSVSSHVSVVTTNSSSNSSVSTQDDALQSNVARVSPLHVVPSKTFDRSESMNEEQLLADSAPTTPVEPVATSVEYTIQPNRKSTSPAVVPRLSTSPISKVPIPNLPTSKLTQVGRRISTSAVVSDVQKLSEKKTKASIFSPNSMEDIQEALNEQKRKQQEDLLSDDEFEKEINDLISGDDDDEDYGDIDEDDLMMELQEMIDS